MSWMSQTNGLELLVDDAVLARRKEQLVLPEPHFQRGYGLLYTQHIEQAHLGCDFDFLLVDLRINETLTGAVYTNVGNRTYSNAVRSATDPTGGKSVYFVGH